MNDIILEGNPTLCQETIEYDFDNPPSFVKDSTFGLSEFIDFMFTVMRSHNGLGLSAPQVSEKYSIFVMTYNYEEIVCINPKILEESSETAINQEGCLSFPHLLLNIKRPASVYVSYQNIDGRTLNKWFSGIQAKCFQHELDHLNGITFDTRASKLSLKMSKDKRRKVLKQLKRKKK